MPEKIAAIVVAYKNTVDLSECYSRLVSCKNVDYIILVDNSWAEVGSCLEYANLTPFVNRTVHIAPRQNLGYAGGNNVGIAKARELGAEYILVCNPDALVNAATLDALVSEINERRLSLLSPRLSEVGHDGVQELLTNPGWDRFWGRGVTDIPHSRFERRYVPTFYGACFLARVEVFDHAGFLSDDFFLYGEEIDFTLRLNRAQLAWDVSKVVTVEHGRGTSISPLATGKSLVSFFHAARSAVIVGRKHWPSATLLWIVARLALALVQAMRGKRRECGAIVGGLLSGVRLPLREL